jgi:hypothetical protein
MTYLPDGALEATRLPAAGAGAAAAVATGADDAAAGAFAVEAQGKFSDGCAGAAAVGAAVCAADAEDQGRDSVEAG